MKIRENASYSGIDQKLCRPVIHTHHIYMNGHIFFWMLRAQIIRICNIEMKIWGCTPSSRAFSKWLSRRKCRKTQIETSVSQHLIFTNIHNLPLDICFWGWKIRWYYLKILYISKNTSKSKMAANFGQKIVLGMKSTNMPVSVLPKSCQNKKF